MKIYPSLFAYLSDSPSNLDRQIIVARNRPVVVFYSSKKHKQLVNLDSQSNAYEIAIPYLRPYQEQLFDKIVIDGNILSISDEVIDKTGIDVRIREQLKDLENSQWHHYFDDSIAELLRVLNGLIDKASSESNNIRLMRLPSYLEAFNPKDANLPLLIWLEQKYQLSHKLKQLTPKLRYQLRRKAEQMYIGLIQEVDNKCLRDYTRRSGRTPEEKAGARQELMGVKRYQDYNTYENKFLVRFADQLFLECLRYELSGATLYYKQVRKIKKVIQFFKQEPSVQTISTQNFRLGTPNYVLQQNSIYNSFYRAYLDYVKKQTEKEFLWSYRGRLLSEVIYLCFYVALLCFKGANIKPLAELKTLPNPDQGAYLIDLAESHTITVFLRKYAYEFNLQKLNNNFYADFYLKIRFHDLYSTELSAIERSYPFWVFWYMPDESTTKQAEIYVHDLPCNFPVGFIFYIQEPPAISSETGRLFCKDKRLWFCQLPDPLKSQGFNTWVDLILKLLLQLVEGE